MKRMTALALLLSAAAGYPDEVTLAWDPVTESTDGALITGSVRYEVCYRTYDSVGVPLPGASPTITYGEYVYADAGTNCAALVTNVVAGQTYQYAVRTYDPGVSALSDPIYYRTAAPDQGPSDPIELELLTDPGLTYTLYECTNLVEGVWYPVEGYIGIAGGGTTYATLDTDKPCAFYIWEGE